MDWYMLLTIITPFKMAAQFQCFEIGIGTKQGRKKKF